MTPDNISGLTSVVVSVKLKSHQKMPQNGVGSMQGKNTRNMVIGYWLLVSMVPFAASFLAEPMVQSSHPPLVAKIQAKIYSGTNNASGS